MSLQNLSQKTFFLIACLSLSLLFSSCGALKYRYEFSSESSPVTLPKKFKIASIRFSDSLPSQASKGTDYHSQSDSYAKALGKIDLNKLNAIAAKHYKHYFSTADDSLALNVTVRLGERNSYSTASAVMFALSLTTWPMSSESQLFYDVKVSTHKTITATKSATGKYNSLFTAYSPFALLLFTTAKNDQQEILYQNTNAYWLMPDLGQFSEEVKDFHFLALLDVIKESVKKLDTKAIETKIYEEF